MTISTITIAAINYTSYASVVEADARLAVDPTRSAAWAALTTDQKGADLVAATYRLDLLTWKGEKAGGALQVNAFPRTGLTYKDGTAVTDTDVPQEVEDATILLAGSIALDASNANQGTSGSNLKRVKAGSAEAEFFRPTTGVQLQDTTAFALVKCFLAGQSGANIGQGNFASGICDTSSFSDRDKYGRNEGYL